MKTIVKTLIIITILSLHSCKGNRLDDFEFVYIQEIAQNYKLQLTLNSNRSFEIKEFNYFFDNLENKQKPITTSGKINEADFIKLKRLIEASNLYRLNDSYGFDDSISQQTDSEIVQQTFITTNTYGDKWVSASGNINSNLPKNYLKLLSEINKFISLKKKAHPATSFKI